MPKRLSAADVKIEFNQTQAGLSVTIETPRLLIRSVTNNDADNYYQLFSDTKVMHKYAAGLAKEDNRYITKRVHEWVERWRMHDPFSGLAVFTKSPKRFIGHVIVGRSDDGDGASELAYLFHCDNWNQGLGSEAVSAIANHYVAELVKRHYQIEGHTLNALVATTHIDNLPSQSILEAVGLHTNKDNIIEKYGAKRYLYRAPISEI